MSGTALAGEGLPAGGAAAGTNRNRQEIPSHSKNLTWTCKCASKRLQVEGYLEEMLLLVQRAEEYNQFMLAKMGDAVAPAPLSAARHSAFRC